MIVLTLIACLSVQWLTNFLLFILLGPPYLLELRLAVLKGIENSSWIPVIILLMPMSQNSWLVNSSGSQSRLLKPPQRVERDSNILLASTSLWSHLSLKETLRTSPKGGQSCLEWAFQDIENIQQTTDEIEILIFQQPFFNSSFSVISVAVFPAWGYLFQMLWSEVVA